MSFRHFSHLALRFLCHCLTPFVTYEFVAVDYVCIPHREIDSSHLDLPQLQVLEFEKQHCEHVSRNTDNNKHKESMKAASRHELTATKQQKCNNNRKRDKKRERSVIKTRRATLGNVFDLIPSSNTPLEICFLIDEFSFLFKHVTVQTGSPRPDASLKEERTESERREQRGTKSANRPLRLRTSIK